MTNSKTNSIILNNGCVYTGNFIYIDDILFLHGKGELLTLNGYKYEGHFIMNIMHGKFIVTNIYNDKRALVEYENGDVRIN